MVGHVGAESVEDFRAAREADSRKQAFSVWFEGSCLFCLLCGTVDVLANQFRKLLFFMDEVTSACLLF